MGAARAGAPGGVIAPAPDASVVTGSAAARPTVADVPFATSERLRLAEATRKRQAAKQAADAQRAAMSRQGPLDKKRDTFFSLGFKTRQFVVSFYDTPFIRYYLNNLFRTPAMLCARF